MSSDKSKIVQGMSKKMQQGWVLTSLTCPNDGCVTSLLRNKSTGILFCEACQANIVTEEEAQRRGLKIAPASSPEASSPKAENQQQTTQQEQNSSDRLSFNEPQVKARMQEMQSVSSRLGAKVLQGWAMLAETCPSSACTCPLVRNRDGVVQCVQCGRLLKKNEDEEYEFIDDGQTTTTKEEETKKQTRFAEKEESKQSKESKSDLYDEEELEEEDERLRELLMNRAQALLGTQQKREARSRANTMEDVYQEIEEEEDEEKPKIDEKQLEARLNHVNNISQKLGAKVLRGYTMLGHSCPNCPEVPLVQKKGEPMYCVSCEAPVYTQEELEALENRSSTPETSALRAPDVTLSTITEVEEETPNQSARKLKPSQRMMQASGEARSKSPDSGRLKTPPPTPLLKNAPTPNFPRNPPPSPAVAGLESLPVSRPSDNFLFSPNFSHLTGPFSPSQASLAAPPRRQFSDPESSPDTMSSRTPASTPMHRPFTNSLPPTRQISHMSLTAPALGGQSSFSYQSSDQHRDSFSLSPRIMSAESTSSSISQTRDIVEQKLLQCKDALAILPVTYENLTVISALASTISNLASALSNLK